MCKQCLYGMAALFSITAVSFFILNSSDGLTKPDGDQLASLGIHEWQEVQANTFTPSTQENAAIDVDQHGNTVVVWDSRRQQLGTYGVYLQRFNATGLPLGSETQVNLFTRNMQTKPSVAVDGLGGTWVAWESFGQDESMAAIIARRFDKDHFTGGDEILVNEITQGHQNDVVVAADSKGNATFVWTTPSQNGQQKIVARRFDSCGTALGGEFTISTSNNNQKLPAIATDGNDRLIVVWAENETNGTPIGIHGRIFDGMGHPITNSLTINADDNRQHIEPSVDALSDGQFAVAWLTTEGSEYAAYARKFDAGGRAITGPQRVSEPDATYVSGAAVALSDTGQMLVSWNRQVDGSAGRDMMVEARILNSDGSVDGSPFKVNRHGEGRHRLTAASGKQRVAWSDERMFFTWSGQNNTDKSSANLTVRVPASSQYALAAPIATPVLDSSTDEVAIAKPHEPPTFDPKLISRDAWGGDTDPVPGPGADFGFIGITSTGWTPPDPSIAVGPNHLATMTNGEIAFFEKNGTKTFSDEIENSFGFWGSLGANNFVFDPEIIYDPHSNRFIAMACERSDNSRSYFLVAISDDDNPNGNWNKYRLDVTSLGGNDIDSPNLAVDDEAVYLTADFFGPDAYLVYILRKSDLIAGNAPLTRNLLITGSQSYGIPVMYDATAPAFYMIQAFEFGTYNTVRMHAITDSLGSPSRVTTDVSVPSYGHPQDPVQQGTSSRPELFEARFWSCVFRDGSLWAVHHQSPNSSGTPRARWYQFDMRGWPSSGMNPILVQSGDIFPGTGVNTFFPSIWVDGTGNAAITCARSASNEFISMSRAVRKSSDPLGTFQPLQFVRQSSAAYSTSRWGDYSGTMGDPSAPGTFWGTHEYTPGGNSWNTWIAQYVIETVPEDILVDQFNILRGFQTGGNINSLTNSDNQYLSVQAGLTLSSAEPPVWIEFLGTSTTDSPSELSFTLEAKANSINLNQVIDMFNFDANNYEQIDSRLATTADSVVQVSLNGDLGRFVDAGGAMKARVGWKAQGIISLFPWQVSIDQVFWTVAQ